MAPPPQTIIEDEEEFLRDLAAFHEQRGTNFDREGKVSGRPISLHKLYKLVLSRGGYDILSGERMQWRTLVKEFGFGKTHEAVMTFQLKTVYYKNLAAYEIARYWGEEPPPREILEDTSAKGGNLRSRTLENYPHSNAQTIELPSAEGVVESADEEQATPTQEKTELEEPGSGGRYPSRQLRTDPKRTQMYQPDVPLTRPRNVRATDSPSAPPIPQQQPYLNASSDPHNPTFDWYQHYQPRPPVALTLQQVKTPGSDPTYHALKAREKLQSLPKPPPEEQHLRQCVPSGLNGPNIYQRCLYGLRSGIAEEQEFALHHLVKVSHERGDKYKFEGFPFLAESLLEKALEITELIYGVKWEITYDEDDEASPVNTLNAAFGTTNLLDRIQVFSTNVTEEDLEDAVFSQRLERLKETALVLRNMVTLDENAVFLAKFPLFKDILTIAITLPDQPRLAEFKQSAMEILEHVTRYWALAPKDSLYLSLIPYLESADRGMLISAIRSINRIGIDTPEVHRLTDIPVTSIERLFSFVLLDSDDELREATLDFLYEYTAIPENNTELLTKNSPLLPKMTGRLTVLLLHRSLTREESIIARQATKMTASPTSIPNIPPELHAQLLQYSEPDRSSRWLRCCFEESRDDDITQIAIWQAYQSKFLQNNPIPAADFIKNVSHTFTTAQAQVINGPQPRFIIKGIKARRVLVDLQGRPLYKCLWEIARPDVMNPAARLAQQHICSEWITSREKLFSHVIGNHVGTSTTGGRIPEKGLNNWPCRWTQCKHRTQFTSVREFARHLCMHIPESAEAMTKLIQELAHDVKETEPVQMKHAYHYTAIDQTAHPCGIPWMSVMIMRNLARYANRYGQAFEKDGVKLNEKLFGNHKYALFNNLGLNRVLRDLIVDLIDLIEKSEREQKKRGVKREHEEEDEEVPA
ncbi:hypothetical protein EDD37DRAFT_629167 [Exophiala viscosa]|uniref:uncharacterized protein n=1 Tax=Exophiala viscosa TaxID=2486360 RepID=UPI002198DB61|nr:hypothetical protein EDD37DRAFT_629167 [Exophiala viscosa]